ncbi:MAG: DUF1501 domain-containing protein [Candidatus Hydrogenedentes bacterium]|nr:DUF1501 domain-containing protein [Candidatus Hydrogenedentota bacterium]
MNPLGENAVMHTRRQFFGRCACGIGTAALGSLLSPSMFAEARGAQHAIGSPHFAPKAKRIIYLFQSGGPSQLDLFDFKPTVQAGHGSELPPSVRGNQRLTTMTSEQKSFPVVASKFKFAQHGPGGAWFSEIIPHMASIADEMCVINSLTTEAINHDPATTYITTGAQLAGRPSMGAWLSYGLGSENNDLPSFCVLISKGNPRVNMQPLYPRIWGAGFLPAEHQGVNLRSSGDPVLYIKNPPGVDADTRRRMLDGLARLNEKQYEEFADPEIVTRIAQYEMAYRMQTSVPELVDFSNEPQHIIDLYGPDVRRPGSYAANCLLARRLAERGVRFVQLFHRGWDQHAELPRDISTQAQDTDQPSAALIKDLKQRGMLEDTLVIWGGEFGRTVYSQGGLQKETYGRDHHGRCYTVWMAGGGARPGTVYGETDDFSYNVARDPVHVHDFNATILHLMGIDHLKLTFPYQGRDFRLTDVFGNTLPGLIA